MSAPSHHITRSTVLLVDDDANVTAALIRHFPKYDYEVFTVSSAAAAYQFLSQHAADVIISDERMPGESGTQFLSRVRHLYPSTIRMVLSGQASMGAAIRAINEAEAYRFFLKPCNPIDLLAAVRQALDERRSRQQAPTLMKDLQAALPSTTGKHPQPSHKLRIGDRVVRRSAQPEGQGTVTQILDLGVVRVLWDFSVPSSMHTRDSLRLASNTDSQSTP